MPENLTDSPVKKEQNEAYKADKTDPMGKPYSAAQVKSGKEAQNKTWLYHEKHGGQIFSLDKLPDESLGWREETFLNANDGNTPVGEKPSEPETAPPVDVGILREECEKRGINFDKRWGKDKLMAALEEGTA